MTDEELQARLASGLPVVASRVGGLPELVDGGHSGILVPPGDEAALAAAIVEVLSNAVLGERLGAGGAARARAKFDGTHFAYAVARVYQDVLGRSGVRTRPNGG